MKTLTHELRYEGATLEQVRAMLGDRAFRQEVLEAQHVLRHEVTVEDHGETMQVDVDQTQDAKGIPSFAKKIVGEEIQIVQHETWTSPTRADLEVVIPGKPGDVTGSITLTEAGDGVVETVRADIKVSIPLVGGKVEGLVSDMLASALRAENKVGRDWLAR